MMNNLEKIDRESSHPKHKGSLEPIIGRKIWVEESCFGCWAEMSRVVLKFGRQASLVD
jgi:hypothetical protein